MFGFEQIQQLAGGTIEPHRFVKLSATENQTLLQAGDNERIFGVSQPGTQDPPNVLGSGSEAAADGEQLEYIPVGRVARIEISAAVVRNDEIESGADGRGEKVTGAGDHEVGGVAIESGAAAGELVSIMVSSYFRQTP